MKKNNIIQAALAAALVLSGGGNIYQATTNQQAEPIHVRNDVETDEAPRTTPRHVDASTPAGRDENLYELHITFAVTYKVQEQAGTPGGYTVTVALPNPSPAPTVSAKKTPGPSAVKPEHYPDFSAFSNIVKVEVASVEAQLVKGHVAQGAEDEEDQ